MLSFAELQFILVTYFEEQLAEMEKTKSASCLFSFFFPKPQSFVVIVSVHKKIDTSKFQLMYNTYLYDQNRRSILMSCTGLKKNELYRRRYSHPLRVNTDLNPSD